MVPQAVWLPGLHIKPLRLLALSHLHELLLSFPFRLLHKLKNRQPWKSLVSLSLAFWEQKVWGRTLALQCSLGQWPLGPPQCLKQPGMLPRKDAGPVCSQCPTPPSHRLTPSLFHPALSHVHMGAGHACEKARDAETKYLAGWVLSCLSLPGLYPPPQFALVLTAISLEVSFASAGIK